MTVRPGLGISGPESTAPTAPPFHMPSSRRSPAAARVMTGGGLLLLLGILCFSAPLFEQWRGMDATTIDLLDRLSGPNARHWLGTDDLGRDVFLRLLQGGQASLTVGIAAALCTALIGTAVGLLAGYIGGRTDQVLMRTTDMVIAVPILPLLILLAALDPAKLGLPDGLAQSPAFSLYRIVTIIALFGWTGVARLVRAATLSIRHCDYVRAARALGAGPGRIMLMHILPNTLSPLLVATTLSVGNIILLESVLSFLGLGIQPPLASWGNMLTNAQETIWSAPALAIYPGLLIFLTVAAFNILGDGLRDLSDPRSGTNRRQGAGNA